MGGGFGENVLGMKMQNPRKFPLPRLHGFRLWKAGLVAHFDAARLDFLGLGQGQG